MSLTWEPRWEPYLVEYAGIRIWTCRDKITKMIACPICINAVRECLGGGGLRGERKGIEYAFFYSARDLILHIKNHYRRPWAKERKVIKVVEEVEEHEKD